MHLLSLVSFLGLSLAVPTAGRVGQLLQCPHPAFKERHVCGTCRNEAQVVDYLRNAGVSSVTAVFGPPHSGIQPLFRPTGMDPRDPCVNSQPRPAYRCNMEFEPPYCFKIGNFCYGMHDSSNGELNSEFIWCVDNYEWQRQHQMDDFDTDRRSDPEIQ